MAEVSVDVRLRATESRGQDPVALERAIASEGRRAARELYRRVMEAKEEAAIAATRGSKQRRERRWVGTLFGRVRIRRYRIKRGENSFHPLDSELGLRRSEASQALRALIVTLAERLSYRDVATTVSEVTGESITYQQVSRVVHDAAGRLPKSKQS